MPDSTNSQCLIAIGCNQGNCRKNISSAIDQIDQLKGCHVIRTSSLLVTQPVGDVQGEFLNGALLVETVLSPESLMRQLLEIERVSGRDRTKDSGNRPVDLDVLVFGDLIQNTELLTVPHPRMTFRRFVLDPAVEIAADMVHPIAGCSLGVIHNRLQTERNVVAVLLPCGFPVDEFDLKHDEKIAWTTPANRAQLIAGLRRNVTNNERWLVVLTRDQSLLDQLRGAIKLLVVANAQELENTQSLLQNHAGPYWDLRVEGPEALKNDLRTAVQSMIPAR